MIYFCLRSVFSIFALDFALKIRHSPHFLFHDTTQFTTASPTEAHPSPHSSFDMPPTQPLPPNTAWKVILEWMGNVSLLEHSAKPTSDRSHYQEFPLPVTGRNRFPPFWFHQNSSSSCHYVSRQKGKCPRQKGSTYKVSYGYLSDNSIRRAGMEA